MTAPAVPSWTFGDRIRRVRRVAQLSQRAMAEALGQNHKTYAAWEVDLCTPRDRVAVAKRVEVLTGTPAWWLLDVAPLRVAS